MRKYLTAYMEYIDRLLGQEKIDNIQDLKKELLMQIQFMQHERLIHLLVTMLFAFMLFMCLGIFFISENILFGILAGILLLPLIPYIWHYYFMENSVQRMYCQYNQLCKCEENSILSELPVICSDYKPSTDI